MLASQLTPSQVKFMQEHKERRARIEAAALAQQPTPKQPVAPVIAKPSSVLPPIPNSLMQKACLIADKACRDRWVPRVQGEIRRIQLAVLAEFPTVTLVDFLSSRRTLAVVFPRQIAMYLAKTITCQSLPEIGRRFGGRDHTTVLHAVRKITQLLETDQALVALIERINKRLGGDE